MSQWYCRTGSVESGPFTIVEMRFLKARGKLGRDSLVRQASESTWHEAKSIPGLFGEVQEISARRASTEYDDPVQSGDRVAESVGEAGSSTSDSDQQDERQADVAPVRPPPRRSVQETSRRRRRNLIALVGGSLLVLVLL